MVEAVVFDLDGVLVDSEPVWEQVRRKVVAEHGGRWAADAQQRLMGMSTAEWASYLSRDLHVSLPPDQVAALVIGQMRASYRENVPLMPGAVQAILGLAAHWPLGLATSSSPTLIDDVLDGGDLRGYFAVTMSTEGVARGKPAPDIYLAVADLIGHAPERCAAIEDSTNGLLSASAAGLFVIAVPHPRYPPDAAALGAASVVLTDLHELTPDVITRLPANRGRHSG